MSNVTRGACTIVEAMNLTLEDIRFRGGKIVIVDQDALEVPSGFFADNPAVVEVVFLDLPRAIRVGRRVLSGCENLVRVDFSGMRAMKSLSEKVLMRCRSLREIDLSCMPEITSIRNHCFGKCTSLRKVSLRGLSKLLTIGVCFCSGNVGLVEADFTGCTSLYSIGSNFCDRAFSLRVMDLSDSPLLSYISNFFCFSCRSLEAVIFAPWLPRLKTIGTDFCVGCRRLVCLDFNALASVYVVGHSFCAYTTSLRVADLSAWQNVFGLGPAAFYGCASLEMILISFFGPALTAYFAAECPNLAHIRFVRIGALEAIGPNFLCGCVGLVDIDLEKFANVRHIGMNFCARTGVYAVDLSPLSYVDVIEPGFFAECPYLTYANTDQVCVA
jgi:hypothetical protein